MRFAGIQKLTLLDYPGKTACTLFTQGCGFRCPFCHNSSLLPAAAPAAMTLPDEEILSFLARRKGILEGVCVSGGEPLMNEELPDFLRRVREMGFFIKLDTNGSYPQRLRALVDEGLIDYAAMDVKNSPVRYAQTCGLKTMDLGPVCESVSFLKNGALPFEFRTTVVYEYHDDQAMAAIGEWLKGNEPYFLQGFVDSGDVLKKGLHACAKEQMEHFVSLLKPALPNCALRGV